MNNFLYIPGLCEIFFREYIFEGKLTHLLVSKRFAKLAKRYCLWWCGGAYVRHKFIDCARVMGVMVDACAKNKCACVLLQYGDEYSDEGCWTDIYSSDERPTRRYSEGEEDCRGYKYYCDVDREGNYMRVESYLMGYSCGSEYKYNVEIKTSGVRILDSDGTGNREYKTTCETCRCLCNVCFKNETGFTCGDIREKIMYKQKLVANKRIRYRFRKIPRNIARVFVHLKELHCDGVGLRKIPQLPKLLEKLSLCGNKIRQVDNVYKLVKLRDLNLSGNYIMEIKPEVENLKKLRYLDLTFNRLCKIPEELSVLIATNNMYVKIKRGNKLGNL